MEHYISFKSDIFNYLTSLMTEEFVNALSEKRAFKKSIAKIIISTCAAYTTPLRAVTAITENPLNNPTLLDIFVFLKDAEGIKLVLSSKESMSPTTALITIPTSADLAAEIKDILASHISNSLASSSSNRVSLALAEAADNKKELVECLSSMLNRTDWTFCTTDESSTWKYDPIKQESFFEKTSHTTKKPLVSIPAIAIIIAACTQYGIPLNEIQLASNPEILRLSLLGIFTTATSTISQRTLPVFTTASSVVRQNQPAASGSTLTILTSPSGQASSSNKASKVRPRALSFILPEKLLANSSASATTLHSSLRFHAASSSPVGKLTTRQEGISDSNKENKDSNKRRKGPQKG